VCLLAACGDDLHANVTIATPPVWAEAVGEMVALTPGPGLRIGTDGDFRIALVDDPLMPPEGYRIDADGPQRWTIHAHDVLGAQYGATDALENLGYRFRHPFDPYVPRVPAEEGAPRGVVHRPQVRVRGLQLHTLHPIESYFAFWEPSAGSTNDAHRIIDWVIKNRGNYLQWVALDDIMDPDRHAAWKTFTQELIADAHMRGVRVGLNIQLFGQSNLQLAFDLSDDKTGTVPIADEIAARLPLVTQDLPFDVYDLSFGEFFGADPQRFIDATNEVSHQLAVLAPAAEMHAVVHVGATQRVTFMGRDLLYYFLVQYADPRIVPDIHTVMYYDLYEDAGGAYHHVDFDEHREYLLDRMCAGEPAAYFPETAYWVAFDDSIPMAVPLYVHSRWLDLSRLAAEGCGPLDEQLLFSSGWEWGYWLHDTTALRASYELPPSPQDAIAFDFAPDLGARAAALVDDLATEQHTALMTHRLAAYLASRDAAIDAGRALDIVSQPDRITFDDLVASGDVAGFTASVLTPLEAHADALDALAARLDKLALPGSRWTRELRDGLTIDRLRARFVIAAYRAVVDHLGGGDGAAAYQEAAARLADAAALVARRHADLHDTHRRRLVDETPNDTVYQYGYLHMADTLCYWHRELGQVGEIVGQGNEPVPGCLF